ncbi:MAG: radical SAM/SPASM domain-containing protein [Bacteriovoracia bacterium]
MSGLAGFLLNINSNESDRSLMPSSVSPELKMVEIEINHHCNRACSYCPNSVAERIEQGEMEPALFEKIMQQLVEINYKGSISYMFYNEPLLSKDLNRFVQMTRQYLPTNDIHLYTNGTLLTLDKFRALYKDGVTRFFVTKHEGVKNYVFDKVYEELNENEKFAVLFKSFRDLKLTNRGGAVKAGPPEPVQLTACFIPQFLAVITVLGNVLPCFEDFHEKNIMGNVGETHLRDIWMNQKFQNFRQSLKLGLRHTQDPCDKCNRTQVCHS